MLEPMGEVVDRFLGHVDKLAEKGDPVEVKEYLQG